MILQFQLPDNFSPTTKKGESSVDGRLLDITDRIPCRELHLFCDSCRTDWDAAVPRRYALYRFPCPHCKCDTKGRRKIIIDRVEW
jgi:hypothetical protein